MRRPRVFHLQKFLGVADCKQGNKLYRAGEADNSHTLGQPQYAQQVGQALTSRNYGIQRSFCRGMSYPTLPSRIAKHWP